MNDRPIRVLLVEDDEEDYLLTRDLFADIANTVYAVDWVATEADAVGQFQQRRHDVYLIDYRLGPANGLELLERANQLRVPAPIIMLTGQGEPEVDMAAMRAGAADFLIKGEITARSLERAVRYAIERKRAEKEIERLAAFPRRNPNPVAEFAPDGTLTYANAAMETLARSLGEETLAAMLPAEARPLLAECLRTGETRTLQTSRGTRSFSWSFVPVLPSGVVHGYATEITERLNLEAQLRHSVKMEAVGQLAAGVAHDFNNILTIIQGHASLLLDVAPENDTQGRSLKQICVAAERASSLIRQLLMFSRKQVMQPQHLDLNEVLSNIMRILQRVMGEDIAVEVIEHAELPSIYGDTGMLEQVVMNLAVNARDAMPRGGKLTIATTLQQLDAAACLSNPEARAGDFVCLTLGDTGCGMDPITLNRIFEPFFTTKEVGKGTGLGLATAYGIVKQHQGWIEVESSVGQGTTFRIFFPTTVKPAQPLPAPGSDRDARGGSETILVVEDEPALRELVTEILTLYGYSVVSAASGVEALRVWEEHRARIGLLLTDMVMPEGVSGRELAERLQRQQPDLKVIYTSGYSPGMAGKDLALLESANFLPKPYPPTRLAEVVRECLDAPRAAAVS